MAAGIAAVDLVLLLTAADEGIMPQTREHLDIISLLNIKRGVLVISKADKSDSRQIKRLTRELRELTAETPLQNAPIIAVSAQTGEGIDKLTAAVCRLAADLQPPSTAVLTRLPVDRCFTVKGFGTVVTGTLWSGDLTAGDAVKILPLGKTARIRRLEVNGKPVASCSGKQRAAVNLPGIGREEIPRGSWLVKEDLPVAHTVLAALRLLKTAPPLKHNTRVHVRFGNREVNGRICTAEGTILPGEEKQVKIHLEKPLLPLPADLLIIASYSPVITIGGAKVLAVNPPKKRRNKQTAPLWENAEALLGNYHRNSPLSPGMPESEFKKKLFGKLSPEQQKQLLKDWQTAEKIKTENGTLSLFAFSPKIDPQTAKITERIMKALTAGGFSPPPLADLLKNLPPAKAKALTELLKNQGAIRQTDGVFFAAEILDKAENLITAELNRKGKITLAEARDLLGTSRKFALSILSYLDNRQITKRRGDYRILNK
jgi:selenocysteine-specific translation elongation factor